MKERSIKIGVVGLGTVGVGVVKALRRNRAIVRARCGVAVELRRVAELDRRRHRASRLPAKCLTTDYNVLLKDPEIDIIVELIGGTSAARGIVLKALRAGKHVVTANKALLAAHWRQIFSVAGRKQCAVGFESSVMAGVPVVRTLKEGLSGNVIQSLLGILNGTSNFVLTRMTRRGMEFNKALDEARRRGLCEADASLDIDGFDAVQKLSILGSIALGKWLPPGSIFREGIGHVERLDLEEAKQQFGYVIRPLAIMKQRKDGVEARVHPTFVPLDHSLAAVDNEFNAILVNSDTAGPVTLSGKGAGERPAASGVVSDVIHIARAIHLGGGAVADMLPGSGAEKPRVVPIEDVETKFYLRFSVVDSPGVLSFIAGVLGRHNVSIVSCHQRGRSERGSVPVFMITHQAREGSVRKALAAINLRRGIVKRKTVAVRIEE